MNGWLHSISTCDRLSGASSRYLFEVMAGIAAWSWSESR